MSPLRRFLGHALLTLALLATSTPALAQELARPVLTGRAFLADSALTVGTVVLHRMSGAEAGEIDSTRVARDGSFSVPLPSVPNPAVEEIYFASVRHAGVVYFGRAIETAAQLDTLYEIQAYDTLVAPPEGVGVALQARNIFLEPNGDVWQVTDVFQLRNDRDRTVVARPDGHVWSYPLPSEAREVLTGEGELRPNVAYYEDGLFVVRAALPPGERLFVVRYQLESPAVTIPIEGEIELFDILVREPAPPLEAAPLQQVESIELDVGQTFRRYAGESVQGPFVRVVPGAPEEPPPVHWIAVALALVLAAGGLLAWRDQPRAAPARVEDRQAVLVELARLDEVFEKGGAASAAAERDYRRKRADLLRRLQSGS